MSNIIDRDYLLKFFRYDNGDLFWKDTGEKLGWKDTFSGYISCEIIDIRYQVHRLIYSYHFDLTDSEKEIDHINGVRDDNRIENLRLVSRAENKLNVKKYSTNKSGHQGVWWDEKRSKYQVYINQNNKRYSLGRFDTFEEAVHKRNEEEKIRGFHENHGR